MVKNKVLALSLFAGFILAQAEQQEQESQLEQKHLEYLQNELKKYRLNAPWLIEECMSLKIDNFEAIWSEIVEILTQAERRWFYFCDKPEDYADELYWKYALKQCEIYDTWLQRLYFNIKTFELCAYDPKMPANTTYPIFDWWDMVAKQFGHEKKYYAFYSFYFDCLTHMFNEHINNGKEEINNTERFKHNFVLAGNCLQVMEKCLQRLRESKQFAQYMFAYRSLQQIYALLEKEKATTEVDF